jgi:hypothetical protein
MIIGQRECAPKIRFAYAQPLTWRLCFLAPNTERQRGRDTHRARGRLPGMMEILSPSPPPSPCPAVDSQLHRSLRYGSRREHRSEAWVHVAVGRSPEKTLGLLRWTLRRFQCGRIALLHVHQPSPLIPTLREYPHFALERALLPVCSTVEY